MLDTTSIQDMMRFLPLAQQATDNEGIRAIDFSKFDESIEVLIKRPEKTIQEINILRNAVKKAEKQFNISKKFIDESLSNSLSDAAIFFDQKANNYKEEIFEFRTIYAKFMSNNVLENFNSDNFQNKINTVEAYYQQAIEACMEFSLFLRASADRFRGEQEKSPYFDDPKALSDYLRKAIA